MVWPLWLAAVRQDGSGSGDSTHLGDTLSSTASLGFAGVDVVAGEALPDQGEFAMSHGGKLPSIQLLASGELKVHFPEDLTASTHINAPVVNVLPAWTAASIEYARSFADTVLVAGPIKE